jgi:hypothetical protein
MHDPGVDRALTRKHHSYLFSNQLNPVPLEAYMNAVAIPGIPKESRKHTAQFSCLRIHPIIMEPTPTMTIIIVIKVIFIPSKEKLECRSIPIEAKKGMYRAKTQAKITIGAAAHLARHSFGQPIVAHRGYVTFMNPLAEL